jgi:hypothetical protein
MISAALTLLLGGANTLLAADPGSNDLPEIFVAACLDGKATFSPGEAAAVGFDGLPRELQQRLGKPNNAQVWRLINDGQAYLYILSYEPIGSQSPKVCGLASDAMNYGTAADTVEKRVMGAVYPRTTRSIQWLDPKGGYNAIATTAGSFKVLQINWLSDQQRQIVARGYQAAQ